MKTEKTTTKSVHYMKIYEKVSPKLRPKYIQTTTKEDRKLKISNFKGLYLLNKAKGGQQLADFKQPAHMNFEFVWKIRQLLPLFLKNCKANLFIFVKLQV